jgi:hypothetical protein
LKAKLRQDPVYAPGADLKSVLAQLLCNHLAGKICIQKAIAHNLTNDLASPTIVGLRPASIADKTSRTMRMKDIPELKVSLTAEAKLPGGMRRTTLIAFSFHKHGQLNGDLVVRINRQGTMGADKRLRGDVKIHGRPPGIKGIHIRRIAEERVIV